MREGKRRVRRKRKRCAQISRGERELVPSTRDGTEDGGRGKAVALIYAVHDLSRGNVASVSDPPRATPASHTLPPSPRHLLLTTVFLASSPRTDVAPLFVLSFYPSSTPIFYGLSFSFRIAREFSGESRFLIYDRPPRREHRCSLARARRGEGRRKKRNSGEGRRHGGTPAVVYFESLSTVASLPA